MAKRRWVTALQVGGLVLTVGLVSAWLIFLRPTALGGTTSYVFVEGQSMEPTMHTGDLAIVRKGSYDVGDTVAFHVPEAELKDQTIIHRIVAGDSTNGFKMRGDNNDQPDQWQPTDEDIVGELWINVPNGGTIAHASTAPLPLAGIAIVLALTMMISGRGKRNRTGGKRMRQKTSQDTGEGRLPINGTALTWVASLVILAIVLMAAAGYAFTRQAHKTVDNSDVQFEHNVSFEYTVYTEPSELDPDGIIGPVTTSSTEGGSPEASPIFNQLAKTMDVGIAYAASGVDPSGLNGDLSAKLEITAQDAWVRTRDLLPPTPFTGGEATAQAQIDLAELSSYIQTIEDQTGFIADSYTVSIVPTVQLAGTVGTTQVDDTYSAAYPINFGASQITPGPQLAFNGPSTVGDRVTQANTIHVLGIGVPVQAARWLFLTAALFALVGAAGSGAFAYRQLSQDEAAMIRARYGSLLVAVTEVNRPDSEKIRVASIQDLVRVAQREGRMILHYPGRQGIHHYVVADGSATYEYDVVSDIAHEPASEALAATP